MNSDFAVAVSDIILAVGTFILGMLLKRKKNSQVWVVLFLVLALAAGLGAIYHGLTKFHTREFWVLVSTSATASAFLFLAAVLTVHKPQSRILGWSWPIIGLMGLLLGGILSPFPFWSISVVSGICLLVSILLLLSSSPSTARNWIFVGIGVTLLALVLQKLAGNTTFHYTQLSANLCFWLGAKRT